MIRELEDQDIALKQFDERLWRIMVESATVCTDGKLTFAFRNGMKIEV